MRDRRLMQHFTHSASSSTARNPLATFLGTGTGPTPAERAKAKKGAEIEKAQDLTKQFAGDLKSGLDYTRLGISKAPDPPKGAVV